MRDIAHRDALAEPVPRERDKLRERRFL